MNDLPAIASYLSRIGAEARSLRTAVIKEKRGEYWTDIAVIRLDKSGEISCPAEFAPSQAEADEIKKEASRADWPSNVLLGPSYKLPSDLSDVRKDDLFELKTAKGMLVMIQQRINDKKSGEKRYVPWTYWSDDQWRKAEPEGPLPIFGMETVKDNTTVFIHEGAKAARAMQRLIDPKTETDRAKLKAHPWGEQLKGAAHIGWIGGALSPARTDWSSLAENGVKRAYIIADNDSPGKMAISRIAQRLSGITVFSIEFNETWPVSFDLADDFPKKFYTRIGSVEYYSGPSFRSLMHPSTWATDLIPNGKAKPIPVLRKEFSDLWYWIEETENFVCKEMPEINYSANQFNAMTSPFSHTLQTSQLVQKTYKGRTVRVCYRPDMSARIITDNDKTAINLHTPTSIKPAPGDPKPWLEFMDHLIADESERKEVMKWCATLIARPEVRMLYGMLLVSEKQGMGKSTLGEKILAPLVGMHNTGFPGERAVVESSFNGWIANKRLVVVGEIYTGQSFKAYNILKSYVTDKSIEVNEKFQRPHTIENWAHILACSNSKKALRVEESDRRWFYPRLNESPWSKEKWSNFYSWLNSGGLNIIMQWAKEYGDYVQTGEHAPMTEVKKDLIKESKGEVMNDWIALLEGVEFAEEAVVFAINDARDYLREAHGRLFDTQLQLKKEAFKLCWGTWDEKLFIDGVLTDFVASPLAKKAINEAVEKSTVDVHENHHRSAKNSALRNTAKAMLMRISDWKNRGSF